MKYECKILIGTTFSGKSTYASKHQFTHKIIETDIVKYDLQRGDLSITDYVNQLIEIIIEENFLELVLIDELVLIQLIIEIVQIK